MGRRARQPRDAVLLLILLAAAALRLLYFSNPPIDAHGWRQVDTSAMARNYYYVSLNPFAPRIDWGGADGRVEAEFPLLSWITGTIARVTGFHGWIGRVVGILFSLALVAAIYALALTLNAPLPAARMAAFFVAFSPAAVFFGRTIMPDTPMLFFSVAALIGFARFGQTGEGRPLYFGAAAFALACLVKLPGIIVAIPIAALVLQYRGMQVLRDRRAWLAVSAALLVTVAWYWYAATLFQRTGLTFGILIHPAKTYPAWVGPGPWPAVFSKWSTPELLTSFDFYERLFARLYHFHLTPVGLTLAVLGAWLWRAPERIVPAAWLAAMIMFVLLVGEGNRAHDYYQLPFVAIAALWFGVAAAPIADPEWYRRRLSSPISRIACAAAIVVLALVSFYYSGVTQTHFRSNGLDVRTLDAGRAVDNATDDRALAVVVDDYGMTSPMLFYFANLRGWSFDLGDVSAPLIDNLRRRGARYFITTQWPRVQNERPDAASFLARYEELPLEGAPADVKVFRFR